MALLIGDAIFEAGHATVGFVIVGSSRNGASPNHSVSDRLIDIGGSTEDGCCSDSTRTYMLGAEPSAEIADYYAVLLEAQRTQCDYAKPGASAESVDRVGRTVIADGGFGQYFMHRTGQGIGLETHDAAVASAGGLMEGVDRLICQLLAADGRMSFTDLGKETGLSTSAVHQRVKRLEQRGVIRGYGAAIDFRAVGLPLTAFISIRPIDPSEPDDAPVRLAGITEIEACHSVAGDESYILKVRVGEPSDLENLLGRIRSVANVSTRTTIVLSTPYEGRSPEF